MLLFGGRAAPPATSCSTRDALSGPRIATAHLVARTSWAAYEHAVTEWVDEPGVGLDSHVLRAFALLRSLSVGIPSTGRSRRAEAVRGGP